MEDNVLTQEEENLLNTVLENENTDSKYTIPENSKSILVEETTSRFSGAMWFDKVRSTKVILAGLGGIGSWCALLLARLRVYSLNIYDDDKVELGNMSGQLYSMNHVDALKVSGVINTLNNYANYHNIYSRPYKYDYACSAGPIMICGFDNMRARRIYYDQWKSHIQDNPDIKEKALFIDGRLDAEMLQIFAIQGNDERAMKEYEEKWLFDDSEAEEAVCSFKQTTFMANMIASLMVNIFVNFMANQCNPIIDRTVPFFTSYNAETMFTKIEM